MPPTSIAAVTRAHKVTLTVAAGYDARPTIGKIRTTVGRTPRRQPIVELFGV